MLLISPTKQRNVFILSAVGLHLRLWKLQAECILVSPWMDSGETFLGVVIIWKRRRIFQTNLYRTCAKCSTKASEKTIPHRRKKKRKEKQNRVGETKENKREFTIKLAFSLMCWEIRSTLWLRAHQRTLRWMKQHRVSEIPHRATGNKTFYPAMYFN